MSGAVDPNDRLFYEISRNYPARPMVCGLYLTLASEPDLGALYTTFEAAVGAHPRLACTLDSRGAQPRWTRDEEFTLDAHIDAIDVPTDADRKSLLLDLNRGVAVPRLDPGLVPGRPPWRCTVVRGASEHGVLMRWHHAFSDAEGMLHLWSGLCAPTADGAADVHEVRSDLARDEKPKLLDTAQPLAQRRSVVGWWLDLLRRRFSREGRRSLGQRSRRHSGSEALRARWIPLPFGLDDARALASRCDAMLNDVFVALSAGAVERYYAGRAEAPAAMRVLSPISARPTGEIELRNRSRALRVELPTAPRPFEDRLREVRAATQARISSTGSVPYWFFKTVFSLPRGLMERIAPAPPFICNYLPWAVDARFLAGAEVTNIRPLMPLVPFQGCTFAYSTYRGALECALTTDDAILPDADAMANGLEAAALALREAARTGDPAQGAVTRSRTSRASVGAPPYEPRLVSTTTPASTSGRQIT